MSVDRLKAAAKPGQPVVAVLAAGRLDEETICATLNRSAAADYAALSHHCRSYRFAGPAEVRAEACKPQQQRSCRLLSRRCFSENGVRTDLAVVHGATGILWYNAGRDGTPRPGPDGVNHTRLAILDEAPTIWEELSSVAKEIGALAPALLAGPPAGAETVFGIGCANLTGEPYSCWHTAVDLLCRQHAGSVYIVAVNPHHHSLVRPTTFCLPAACCVPTADEVLPCRSTRSPGT